MKRLIAHPFLRWATLVIYFVIIGMGVVASGTCCGGHDHTETDSDSEGFRNPAKDFTANSLSSTVEAEKKSTINGAHRCCAGTHVNSDRDLHSVNTQKLSSVSSLAFVFTELQPVDVQMNRKSDFSAFAPQILKINTALQSIRTVCLLI